MSILSSRCSFLTATVVGSALALSGSLLAPAFAGTATADLKVSATVVPICTITTTDVAFGIYDQTKDNDATGTITTTCNVAAPLINLGEGANSSTPGNISEPQRQLKIPSTTNVLSYNLYRESNRTSVWGGISNSGVVVNNGNGNGTFITTVYGRIPLGQNNKLAGTYNDTVIATVTF